MKDFINSINWLSFYLGFCFTVILMIFIISCSASSIKVDSKIQIDKQVYRINDIKVVDDKNIVLKVYQL